MFGITEAEATTAPKQHTEQGDMSLEVILSINKILY